jgi:hypothetical protein
MNDLTPKHRRTVAEIREEHLRFVALYQSGLTPFEIMLKLNISKMQYKKHFADAIFDKEITLAAHVYGTCSGKHLPKEILVMLQATKEDLIRFECSSDNRVILSKVDI